jgi:hypothetical protein
MDRPRRTFIRIDAPAKEMTAFIRLKRRKLAQGREATSRFAAAAP